MTKKSQYISIDPGSSTSNNFLIISHNIDTQSISGERLQVFELRPPKVIVGSMFYGVGSGTQTPIVHRDTAS
jgi:hypothetical protein